MDMHESRNLAKEGEGMAHKAQEPKRGFNPYILAEAKEIACRHLFEIKKKMEQPEIVGSGPVFLLDEELAKIAEQIGYHELVHFELGGKDFSLCLRTDKFYELEAQARKAVLESESLDPH